MSRLRLGAFTWRNSPNIRNNRLLGHNKVGSVATFNQIRGFLAADSWLGRSHEQSKTTRTNRQNFDRHQYSDILLSKEQSSVGSINLRQKIRLMSSSTDQIEAKLKAKYSPREITFKAPSGQIAGLEWGNSNAPHKILCCHGWLDNAGSFERIMPYILDHKDNANNYHVVALDSAGVGLSSHRPPGGDYSTFSYIVDMRRVVQQLGWTKLTLLAHSFGVHLAFTYASVYPDQALNMISIDLAFPLTRHSRDWHLTIANAIEDQLKYEYVHDEDPTTNIRVQVYSEIDAIKRLMDAHSNSLTKESAEVLLKRGAKKQRWGYTFNRDIRVRYPSVELRPNDDLMMEYLEESFKSNLLIIKAASSPYSRTEDVRIKYYKLYERKCPTFRETTLDGTHHLHMNDPGLVAPVICEFLDEVLTESKQVQLSKSNL